MDNKREQTKIIGYIFNDRKTISINNWSQYDQQVFKIADELTIVIFPLEQYEQSSISVSTSCPRAKTIAKISPSLPIDSLVPSSLPGSPRRIQQKTFFRNVVGNRGGNLL